MTCALFWYILLSTDASFLLKKTGWKLSCPCTSLCMQSTWWLKANIHKMAQVYLAWIEMRFTRITFRYSQNQTVSLINPFSPTEGILYPRDNDSCLITFHAGWTPEITQWKQRNNFQLDIWCNKFVRTLSILITENYSKYLFNTNYFNTSSLL